MSKADRRKAATEIILSAYEIDKSGRNLTRKRAELDAMSDERFAEFMANLRDGKERLTIEFPNMDSSVTMSDLIDKAHQLGFSIFQRIRYYDAATGKNVWSKHPHAVHLEPVRRTQQYAEHKISVPDGTNRIDAMTGQVSGDDQTASLSNPEILALDGRRLTDTLRELLQARGGNIYKFADLESTLEETGRVSLDELDPNSRTRISTTVATLLAAMHIDNNIAWEN